MMMGTTFKRTLVLLACVTGCDLFAPESPPLPAGAVEVPPHDSARVWWAQVETCSGRHRAVDEVRWYAVDRVFIRDSVVSEYVPHYAIVHGTLTRGLANAERHEMLHAIRKDVGHTHGSDFTQACKPLVTL